MFYSTCVIITLKSNIVKQDIIKVNNLFLDIIQNIFIFTKGVSMLHSNKKIKNKHE